MNPEQRDLLSDALTEDYCDSLAPILKAARSRRRSRLTRQLTGITAIIAIIAAGVFAVTALLPDKLPVAANLPSGAPAKKLQLETIDDSQLLALLADQGPVLVTDSDGSQRLILTRPQ